MDTVYFQTCAVHAKELDDLNGTINTSNPPIGLQWRMSYVRPPVFSVDDDSRRVLAVADKLILKGYLTILSPSLEKQLGRKPTYKESAPQIVSTPALDSEEEGLFWKNVLPNILGPRYTRWVTPQIEIASLAPGSGYDESEQRVDFLISHPDLSNPIVIEIDGDQHRAQENQDSSRDRHLIENGYDVVRVPASEVRAGTGIQLDNLTSKTKAITEKDESTRILTNPIRRAGQLQVALLQALHLGYIPLEGGVSVSTDLVKQAEITEDEFTKIVEDFTELLVNIGKLYSTEILQKGIKIGKRKSDLTFDFYERSNKEHASIYIEDVHLPIRIRWLPRPVSPALPHNLDPELLTYFLNKIFRKPAFRDGQLDIVVRSLEGQDTVALLPTGAGKSIAFQLAGMLLPGRTIVIAPIISLIRDQVFNLGSYGIDRALGITGDLGGRIQREIAYLTLGQGEAFFYYIAPERMQMADFREKLRGMTTSFPVNLIVVDEAHCVSEWGHDFRTAYLRIGDTARECSSSPGWTPPMIALTGTASRAVLRDLQRELKINDFDAIVTPTSFDREELKFNIFQGRSDQKGALLEFFLKNRLPSEFGLPPDAFFRKNGSETQCGLVFCPNVNGAYGVTAITGELKTAGIDCEYYSGGKPKDFYGSVSDWNQHKREVERRYKKNEIPILVSTKAFGMGIDKPNIRFTVHYGVPASIEAFYQEAGRAGRDGKTAICTAIVSDDRPEENRQILAPATPIETVAEFVNSLDYEDNDDITRSLFFHVKTFKGVEKEIEVVRGVLDEISPTGKRANRTISFGSDRNLSEKALHRLVVIGVIADYTVDYSASEFTVFLANVNRRQVIEKYTSYVAGYQSGRAEQERKKASQLTDSWPEFVIGVVTLYVKFVYDVIERGQRRAIAEMLAACQAGDGEKLRGRILAYLDQSEFSEIVEQVLEDSESGLGKVAEVLSEIMSPNEATRLRGPVSRALETYPDHPGLLILRSAAEALARDGEIQATIENYDAFLKNGRDAYGLSDTQIANASGALVRALAKKNSEAAVLIEQAFLRELPSRDAAIMLIGIAGAQSVRLATWHLLVSHANQVLSRIPQR